MCWYSKGVPYGVEQVDAIFEYRSTKYAIETAVVGEGMGVPEVEDDGCCCWKNSSEVEVVYAAVKNDSNACGKAVVGEGVCVPQMEGWWLLLLQ